MIEVLPLDKLRPSAGNRDVGDVTKLAESLKADGQLQNLLVAREPDGGYEIVFGARRHAAAKLARLDTLQCEVRDMTPAERQELRIIENLHREDLSELQEARAFATYLEVANVSQRKAAERLKVDQSHISRRLVLLELPDKLQAELDAGDITVGDALELTKLKASPKQCVDALARARTLSKNRGRASLDRADVAAAVKQTVTDMANDEARAQAADRLANEGVKVVDMPRHGSWYSVKFRKLAGQGNDYYGYTLGHVKVDAHVGERCHGAVIEEDGKVVYVCTNPGKHPEPGRGRGSVSDEEKKARAAKREHNRARRDAEAARSDTIAATLAKRLPRTETVEHVLWHTIYGCEYATAKLACELLGVDEQPVGARGPRDGGWYNVPGYGFTKALAAHAEQSADALLKVALAVAVASAEKPMRADWPQWGGPAIARHFTFLEARGHEVSKAERLELAGKAPR